VQKRLFIIVPTESINLQFPKSDSVVDYVSANQLHVPLQEELFGGLCDVYLTGNIDSVDIQKRNFFNGKPIERV